MPTPPGVRMKRPGLLIPVFFLSSMGLSCQIPAREAAVISLGGSFVTYGKYLSGAGNQAGLGWAEGRSLSIHQSMPFLAGNLTCATVGFQSATGHGGIGMHLSVRGIPGLYHSSLWLSCGIRLSEIISTGAGIQLCNTSIPEAFFHRPGISCALGIQVRPGENWLIGGHVLHPAGWTAERAGPSGNRMMISAGVSYRFFNIHTWYAEFHLRSFPGLQLCQGIRSEINDSFSLTLGFHNQPCTLTGGVQCTFSMWTVQLAFAYMTATGSTPHATLAYEWE